MTNEEKILAMLTEMKSDMGQLKSDVSTINERLDAIETKIDDLTEAHEITREGVNKVAEWADNAGFLLKIPFGTVAK